MNEWSAQAEQAVRSKRTNRRVSGPVHASELLGVLDHSGGGGDAVKRILIKTFNILFLLIDLLSVLNGIFFLKCETSALPKLPDQTPFLERIMAGQRESTSPRMESKRHRHHFCSQKKIDRKN